MNNVILVGRLTRNPEMKQIGNNIKAQFSIAVDRDFVDSNGVRGVDFIPIEIWGKQAETCLKYLYKGRQVGIEGKILIDRYKTKEGENKSFAKIKANSFKFLDSKKEVASSNYFDSSAVFEDCEKYYEENVLYEKEELKTGVAEDELPF